MEYTPHILLGVARGKKKLSAYPHLTFEVTKTTHMSPLQVEIQRHAYYLLKKGTFIGWCMQKGYTYCTSIYLWIRGDKTMDTAESYEDLIRVMKDHKSGYFEPRHFARVDHVYKMYQEEINDDQGDTKQLDSKN